MKKIPKKNYLFLLIVIIITVALVFYVRGWYNATKEYYRENSAVKDVVREINENEISSYIIESQKFILYTSSGKEEKIKTFEEKFKKLIKQMDIQNEIIYLNLDNVDIESFNNKLKASYALNNRIQNQIINSSQSTIYVFNDGKIISVLNNVDKYSIDHIKTLLKGWNFKND